MRHARRFKITLIDSHHVLRRRPSVDKCIMRYNRDSIRHVLVYIRDVVDRRIPVDDRRVVNVGHLRDVHRGIGDVHVVHISTADAISGDINFAVRGPVPISWDLVERPRSLRLEPYFRNGW